MREARFLWRHSCWQRELQPELTRATRLFNKDMRRFKLIGELEMEAAAIFSQDGWPGNPTVVPPWAPLGGQKGWVNPLRTGIRDRFWRGWGRSLLRQGHRRWFGLCVAGVPKFFLRRCQGI